MPLLTLLRGNLGTSPPSGGGTGGTGGSGGGTPPPTASPLQFVDETGVNPLPAGVLVSVYGGSQTVPAALVGQAFTLPGGTATLTLQPGGLHTATFQGIQAPSVSSAFTTTTSGTTTVAVVSGYRSPALSAYGYAAEKAALLPSGPGWWSDAAKLPGGNLYPLLYGLAGSVAQLDAQAQLELARMRLLTCTGGDIDGWAYDFLGNFFLRAADGDENDQQWLTRILAILQTQKCTIAGLQAIITAFLGVILDATATATAFTQAADTQGGADTYGAADVVASIQTSPSAKPTLPLGADTYGGVDSYGFADAPLPTIQTPAVVVFDKQTNPTLAAAINMGYGYFCVYLQYPSYSDSLIHVVQPLNTILSSLVTLWKASGFIPVYASNL